MNTKLLTVILLSLAFSGCSSVEGPKPRVGAVIVHAPTKPGESYKVDAEIINDSAGNGTVSLEFELKDSSTHARYQENTTVHLEGHEAVHRTVEIYAPEATYAPEVNAQYPPE